MLTGGRTVDVKLSQLESLAKSQRFAHVWPLLREIELEMVDRGAAVVRMEDRFLDEWRVLFAHDHVRAEQVLVNLIHQEKLGYTQLVSTVVRAIIDQGPNAAAGEVAALLHSYREKERPKSVITKLRRQMAAEYEEIG